MKCQECKDLFVEAYYNELNADNRSTFDNHLAACPECSAAYFQMAQTLKLMDKRIQIEPDEQYMANYWDTLKSKISPDIQNSGAASSSKKILFFRPLPAWAYGIAAMVLIALGVYLGKTIFTAKVEEHITPSYSENAGVKKDTSVASGGAIDREVGDYLDRSRVLLLGVINSSAEQPSATNYKRQQRRSRELVQQAAYLKTTLNDPDQEQIRRLIGDLEIILMQLANYSNENGVPLVELVKQGVDKKSILLKINLEQIRALGAPAKGPDRSKRNDQKS
jgi:hypothetical protein